jgi:hypothetical protein
MLALLALLAATAGCGKTLVDENGKNLIPSVCSCTAPTGGSPVCNPDGSCDYVCTDTLLLKCGGECIACSAPANAIPACVQGACGFACNSSTRLCPAAPPSGQATCQLETDASCGPSCAACPGPPAGGRGVCNPGPAVGAGTCAVSCDAGFHVCGTAGTSCFADDDAAHCGAACLDCSASAPANASPLCTGGACAFTCNPGWMRCGGGCCRAGAVAAGGEFSCAILGDGRVRCWGANDRGQLGDGTTTFSPVPVDVKGLPASSPAVAVATGWAHACAVVSPGGQVWCWGDNTTGELGPAASGAFSRDPVQVTGVAGVAAPASGAAPSPLAAGGGAAGSPPAPFGHTCAVASGTLLCWGANGSGQLGRGTTSAFIATPGAPTVLGAVTAVAAGEAHTCAVSGGGVSCFGANGSGQIGDGSTTTRSSPVQALAPASAASFAAAGRAHSCAVAGPAAHLACWGDNGSGQVNAGSVSTAPQLTPLAVSLGGGFAPSQAAAGGAFTCGVESGPAFPPNVKCFGANDRSQLATTASGPNKVDVSLPAAVQAIAAGGSHGCALLGDGGILCWGANDRGQTGTGLPTTAVAAPTFVSGR